MLDHDPLIGTTVWTRQRSGGAAARQMRLVPLGGNSGRAAAGQAARAGAAFGSGMHRTLGSVRV
jgi:hypothetical protein